MSDETADACAHTPTAQIGWLGHNGPRSIAVCDDCGKQVWDTLAQPLRETFWSKANQ